MNNLHSSSHCDIYAIYYVSHMKHPQYIAAFNFMGNQYATFVTELIRGFKLPLLHVYMYKLTVCVLTA